MFPSIATVCLSGSLQKKIKCIAAAGFKDVEIFENDLTAFEGSVKDAGQLVKDHGLKVTALQPFRDFEGLTGRDRQLAFNRAEVKFEQMAELGTDLLMICSSCHPNSAGGIERIAADFDELGDLAEKHNMRIAYEALAWGKHIHDYRDSWEIVRRANHSQVGLVLDTFHIFSRGTDLSAIENIPGDKIFLVQTADAPALSMDHLSWSRHYRCFPGQGELDISRFMRSLTKTGYEGPLSHEIFNDVFRRSEPAQTARDGFRSSLYLESMIQNSTNDIPSPETLRGFDFVEIACQPKHLDSLRKFFSALGFFKTGTHKLMPAEQWCSGELQFILNSDEDFADQFLTLHGTSVVAVGIKVDIAFSCTKRAKHLKLPIIEPKQVGAEHNMVGLKNVDGTVWYWVDRSTSQHAFENSFVPTGVTNQNSSQESTLISQIDHISMSQSYPDFLSTLQSFRSLFNLTKTSVFDVFDPKGLIQSQVVQNEDLSFQLAFNVSDAQSTTSAKFIERSKGSGVQHIALRTQDIFTCANALKGSGTSALKIPKNYYADLHTRFDINPSFVERLKSHQILYDEDEHGAFYQLYTLPLEGKFFFEFVQRDNYKGLGASNAWLRASAQQSHYGPEQN